MRISDWSSDVCSSDLDPEPATPEDPADGSDSTDTPEANPYPEMDESIPTIALGNDIQDGSVVTGTTTLMARATESVDAVQIKIYVDGALKASSTTGDVKIGRASCRESVWQDV